MGYYRWLGVAKYRINRLGIRMTPAGKLPYTEGWYQINKRDLTSLEKKILQDYIDKGTMMYSKKDPAAQTKMEVPKSAPVRTRPEKNAEKNAEKNTEKNIEKDDTGKSNTEKPPRKEGGFFKKKPLTSSAPPPEKKPAEEKKLPEEKEETDGIPPPPDDSRLVEDKDPFAPAKRDMDNALLNNVASVVEYLQTVTEKETLQYALDQEKAAATRKGSEPGYGKTRSTVVDAIHARAKELKFELKDGQ